MSRVTPSLRVVLALLLFAQLQPTGALGATFNVTDTADPGTLRAAVVAANAAGGTNTISWQNGSGGANALGSDLPGIAANTTLDASNANAAPTIAGPGGIGITGVVTLNNTSTAQTFTIGSVVSGSGTFIVSGAGTTALTGANTYTGATQILGGTLGINSGSSLGAGLVSAASTGTLLILGNLTDSHVISVGQTNFTINTNGNYATLNGAIFASGTLTKSGAGTLALTSGNSYTGGTHLNAGTLSIRYDSGLGSGTLFFDAPSTLQMSAVFSDARSVVLNADGTFDVQASTTIFYGGISGAGKLIKTSTGTLVLAGQNSYLGGTTINGGILGFSQDANLGAAAGGVTLNGGTLQTQADLSTARAITLGAGGGTIDVDFHNSTLSGPITGAGALTKQGTGTLTLSAGAANAYTGGTTVAAGTLALGAANSLPTGTAVNGALTLSPNATFDMNGFDQTNTLGPVVNNGTINVALRSLTMNNGYASASGGKVALTLNGLGGGGSITGANLNLLNTTLALTVTNPAKVTNGQVFTPITGTHSNQFATINGPAAFSYTPDYSNAGQVSVSLGFVPFATTASNGNQSAVGRALEPLRASPSADMAAVFGQLYTLDAPGLRAAMDRIGPINHAALSGLGAAGASVHSSAVGQRMNVLARREETGGLSTYRASGTSSVPGTLLASAVDMGALDPGGHGSDSPWGVFASAVGTTGHLREANSDAGPQPGYSYNSAGLTSGADRRVRDHLAAGFSLGYLLGHASMFMPAQGTVDNRSLRYGVYGTAFADQARANLYVGGAHDMFTTNRGIIIGAMSRTASASPTGEEFNLSGDGSFDLATKDWGVVTPFAAFNYDRLMIGSFTEDGAGDLNLNVGAQTSDSLRSSLGMRYSQKLETSSRNYLPYASLAWRHEFKDQARPIGASLANGAGTAFTVNSGSYARNGTLLGFGVSLGLTDSIGFKLDYSGDFRSHFQESAYNATLRFRF